MEGVNIVCISQASFTIVNRTVYRALKTRGWNIQLVAPAILDFPGGKKNADPAQETDPPMHFLELLGKNPRIQKYAGLIPLLQQLRPAIIYLDNDPASRMAATLAIWCNKN